MATYPDEVLTLPLQYMAPSDVLPDPSGVAALEWPPGHQPFGNEWKAIPGQSLSSAHWRPAVLASEEIATIIGWARAMPEHALNLVHGAPAPAVSFSRWIEPKPDNHWLYHRVGALLAQVNKQYGFTLAGISEALQYVEYEEGAHWHWQMDLGTNVTSLRKLAVVIQLSARSEYDGGELEFTGLGQLAESASYGSATFFPAYLGHRMVPITRGKRRALLAWASGPTYR